MHVQLKAFLIALAAFAVFDAAVWHGQYREKALNKASMTAHWVTKQKWG